jgi:hypothetical protein
MAAATVSQIFVDLRQMAGISERATAHMLRHRWITLQLIFRLKRLQRRGIIAAEALVTILSRLASISGHGSVDSLWTYVDFAYEELLHESTEEYVPAALVEARKVASDLVRNLSARGSNKLDVRHLTRLDVLLAEVEELARYPVAAQSVAAHSLARHAEWN